MNNLNSAAALPAETDVLIVGYGPAGAALAALLGRYGVRTLVIDKLHEVMVMPRAIALDNEALRVLQMTGLPESAFERVAIPEVRMHCPHTGQFGYVNTGGSIDGHPKLVTFYQPELERALRDLVATLPVVTVRSGWELVSLTQDAKRVSAVVRDARGVSREISARYLIGADGASSKVRGLIGQDFQGKTYAEDWLIVDAANRKGRAIDHVEFICNPKRPAPHMPAPGGRERWEFMLQPGETREEMERPEKIAELLSPWVDSRELQIERHAVYRFHARCCESFQSGRVFLVGDAAHVTPPFVGQGLVAGLRDVANIGWKLAWVINGMAGESLLDSYDQERRPHAKKMIDLARYMGYVVMPRNTPTAIALHGAMRFIRLIPPLRRLIEDLRIKPANRFDKGFFIPGRSGAGLQRGGQLPQDFVRSGDGVRLSDDVLGDKLALVGFGVDPRSLLDDTARASWESLGGGFLHIGQRGETAGGQADFAEDLGGALLPATPRGWVAVVRPDRVVMHDGPSSAARDIVRTCMVALAA